MSAGVWYDRSVGITARVAGVLAAGALALLSTSASAGPPKHFDVAASFSAPDRAGQAATLNVLFSPTDPDVRINEEPAPRLKLDPEQGVLVDRQKPPRKGAKEMDPDKTRFIDLTRPVRFPVALAEKAPRGAQEVGATVVYFYCSKREGWCRRGRAEIRVTVDVP